ncbi:MAG: hypothetical protein HC836_23285 [Richelia sp. RM2_1_2]|nr:hypothetical protein [Richelia sp. RM2_1_2]
MTWNYRVVSKPNTCHLTKDEEPYFCGIHEVYYDTDGNITACTENPVEVVGSDMEEIRWVLSKMSEALDKPVLNWDTDIPNTQSKGAEVDDGEYSAEDGC